MSNKEHIKFVILEDGNLNEKELNILTELYRKLFSKIYGFDLFDSFLEVTNITSNEVNGVNKVEEFSENYNLAKETLLSIQDNNYLKLLCIYHNNELIGGGRICEFSKKNVGIIDLVNNLEDITLNRNLWEDAINFVGDYYKNKSFKKMFLEIPVSEPVLLGRSSKLGFIETMEDEYKDKENTYLVYKELGR